MDITKDNIFYVNTKRGKMVTYVQNGTKKKKNKNDKAETCTNRGEVELKAMAEKT